MILSREDAIAEMARGMKVEKTDMYYICTSEDNEQVRFPTEMIDLQRLRYEKAGYNFSIEEFAAVWMYNRQYD